MAIQTLIRTNVWRLNGNWTDEVLWYARGVAAMMARPLQDPTSWKFYAAIHGIDQGLWQQLGYLAPTDTMPSTALIRQYWKQCQHGSWYFLPWHRGYLFAIESIIRAEIVKLGGSATWALPYWNYFRPSQNALPPPFGSPDWPDGKGNNPLYIKERYGPKSDGNVYVPVSQVNLSAMNDPDFTGVSGGGSPGFGGIDTGFSHGGDKHGGIETQPHDYVHGLVGGANPGNGLPGLMSEPDTAGLDPIFWLHHANIDRLWEVWNQNPATDVNPVEPNWLNGPTSVGERAFVLPVAGATPWTYTPADVATLAKLGYTYDDLSPAPAPGLFSSRLIALGVNAAVASRAAQVVTMSGQKNVELVGASAGALNIQGNEAHATVRMENHVRLKVTNSLALASRTAAPDRVFLNLENVRGQSDSTAFDVYIGLPEGESPVNHPELQAGSVSLFGVRKASLVDGEHSGQGLTYVFEITKIIDALHLAGKFDVSNLPVQIVPVKPVPAEARISIGRVSIFRQGA